MAIEAPNQPHPVPSGITVIVVGLGLGGLATAIESHQKGHSVVLLEKMTKLKEDGMVILLRAYFAHYLYYRLRTSLEHSGRWDRYWAQRGPPHQCLGDATD